MPKPLARNRSPRARRKPQHRLFIECLETRRVLAASVSPLADPLAELVPRELGVRTNAQPASPDWIVADNAGRLGVTIKTEAIQTVVPLLENAGLQVITSSQEHFLIEGLVAPSQLDDLAQVPGVWAVLPTYKPVTFAGSIDGDAHYIHEASRVIDEIPGVDGSGIRIGVLSDSYDNLVGEASDIASGDLPSNVTVIEDLGSGGIDEGRAMLQLVHDIAPGATLGFATAFTGELEFANHIRELADPAIFDADIVVDDIIYFAEPYFQDGIVAQAVDDVVQNDGAAYFSSAGNGDTQSYEVINPSFSGGLHDFDSGPGVDTRQLFNLNNETVRLALQWDDPFYTSSGVDSDVDMFLVEVSTGNTVAQSIADNPRSQVPFEFLQFTGTGQFELIIEVFSGPNPGRMKWIDYGSGDTVAEFATNSSTVVGHAAAASGRAVAAAPYFDHDSPESFTSEGPTTILFDANGNAMAPEVRQTPQITAVDGIENTFFGQTADFDGDGNASNYFFGTSAAAPNAAAVAALVLDANPSFTPQQIYDALENSATDIHTPGRDNLTGVGLINAWDAIFGSASPATLTVSGSTATYTENFDSGQLSTEWETNSTNGGRIRVLNSNPSSGIGRLSMDAASDGFSPQSLNEAILHLDLAGFSDISLQFDQAETGDETTTLPSSFAGSTNGDGVSFSVDGTNWFTLASFSVANSNTSYQTRQFNLSQAATDAGVTLNANTQIKFQQFDNLSEPGDGISIDSVSVTASQPVTTSTVAGSTINDGSSQRSQITSLSFEFDGLVDHAELVSSAFTLQNIDTSTSLLSSQLIVTPSDAGGRTTIVVTFGVGNSVVLRSGTGALGNSLADGNYEFRMLSSQISSLQQDFVFGGQNAGVPAANNDNFFRLYGDMDGDGDTDSNDLQDSFAPAFFSVLGDASFAAGLDGDGDGDVDANDLNDYFAMNFFAVRQ